MFDLPHFTILSSTVDMVMALVLGVLYLGVSEMDEQVKVSAGK